MSSSEQGIRIATGRREGDGHVRLSMLAGDLLALAVEVHGERAATLLLTHEQATKLQQALAALLPQFAPEVGEPATTDGGAGDFSVPHRSEWNGPAPERAARQAGS